MKKTTRTKNLSDHADPQDLVRRLHLIRKDPIEFLKAVRTQDQVDKNQPIKNFPLDLDYLQLYARVWQKEPLLAIPKSRRMKLSWATIALYLWDTMFNIGRHNAFVSKKDEDSADLVKRAKFIYDNLDPEILPREILPKLKYTDGLMDFVELDSRLQGFPSGSDQMRQFTFSGMFFDEAAFWRDAQEAYSAAFPTTEGGGRLTMVSSAAPGFFQRVVFDQIDKGQATFSESSKTDIKPSKRSFPMQGIEIWKNKNNRFCVMEIHYTADPAKRSPEFKERIKASLPYRDYLREYEISWETWEGLPVYPDFDQKIHGSEVSIDPHIGLPLIRGWDFGLTPACVVCQIQGESLVVMKEFVAFNMGVERFSEWVLSSCKVLYPTWGDLKKDWIDFIDPSGFARKDTDESSCAQVLGGKGLKIAVGEITWTKRLQAVEAFLTRRTKEGPNFRVSLADCAYLVRGFKGGYHYMDGSLNMEANEVRPNKNEYSHVHDALQMVASGIKSLRRSKTGAIPTPSYSFNK